MSNLNHIPRITREIYCKSINWSALAKKLNPSVYDLIDCSSIQLGSMPEIQGKSLIYRDRRTGMEWKMHEDEDFFYDIVYEVFADYQLGLLP